MHSRFFESDQLDSVVSPIQEGPPQGCLLMGTGQTPLIKSVTHIQK